MSDCNIYFYKDEKTRQKVKNKISQASPPSSVVIDIYQDAATSILENSKSANGDLCEMHLWEFLLYGEKAFEDYHLNALSDPEKEKFDAIDFDKVCACFESHEALPKELKNTIHRLKQKFKNVSMGKHPVSLPQDSTLSASESTYLLSVNNPDPDSSSSRESNQFDFSLSFFNFFSCCIQGNKKNSDESQNIPLQLQSYQT